jgi:hypothetical protein
MEQHNSVRWIAGLAIAIVVLIGCTTAVVNQQPRREPPAVEPQEETAATQPLVDAVEVEPAKIVAPPAEPEEPRDPFRTQVSVKHPTDQQVGWARVMRQKNAQQTSTLDARYEPHNEFRIHTHNVESFQLDQTQLPVQKSKRFIMHIDGQHMSVNPNEQGPVTFERNSNGIWKYVRPPE